METADRLVGTDRASELQGSLEIAEYELVTGATVASGFDQFTLQVRRR